MIKCVVLTVVAGVVLFSGAGIMAGSSDWLARAVVYAPNTDKVVNPEDDPSRARLAKLGVDRQLRVDVGPPSASLAVWIIEPANHEPGTASAARGTIFVLHGIQDKKLSMLAAGRMLTAAGYRAVLVDFRGHGRSSGKWLTYGAVESQDLSQVLDALNQKGLIAGHVGAFGVSYGGATAILWASRDPRVEAVVTVAAFASMREEVRHYLRSSVLGRFLSEDRIERAIKEAAQLAQFDPRDAMPVDAITRTKAQVLLIHGKADRKIPCRQSEEIHAAAPDHSQLVLVDGENHDSILRDRNGTLSRGSIAWFGRWLAEN